MLAYPIATAIASIATPSLYNPVPRVLRSKSKLLDFFSRTRATNLYQNDVELELVSRILGHASTQTTRLYAKPSLEMIKAAMNQSNPELNTEQQLWPDDEDELARLCGLR